jgi:toxin YhaV
MTAYQNNGWRIYYHPLFAEEYRKLERRVVKLKARLPESEFKSHSTVKLYAAIVRAIEDKIPLDPFAPHFRLYGLLKEYCRVKKMGIPERYRLFFRAFNQEKIIIILWLGFPRKEGDKNDCYAVFNKMVSKGKFPETVSELIEQSLEESKIK